MKSERTLSNLRRQVMEIEVKEGKLRYRKEQLLERLRLMEESKVSEECQRLNYGVSSIDGNIEELARDINVFEQREVDDDSWAKAAAFCVKSNWDVRVEDLLPFVRAFRGASVEDAIGMLADSAPDMLKLRPPEGKFFPKESFVFNHPNILVLQ